MTLAPGELLLEDVPIYFARDGWFLSAAGEYRFRARYATERGDLESNETRISVAAPSSSAGRAAAETFVSTAAGKTFYLGPGKGDDGLAHLRRMAERQGDTSWGAFARLALEPPRSGGDDDVKLLMEVPDPAIAAAAARGVTRNAGPGAVEAILPRLLDAAESPLVRRWIEQTVRLD